MSVHHYLTQLSSPSPWRTRFSSSNADAIYHRSFDSILDFSATHHLTPLSSASKRPMSSFSHTSSLLSSNTNILAYCLVLNHPTLECHLSIQARSLLPQCRINPMENWVECPGVLSCLRRRYEKNTGKTKKNVYKNNLNFESAFSVILPPPPSG